MEGPYNSYLSQDDVDQVLKNVEPYIEIVEQPEKELDRFRYRSERKIPPIIQGVNSDPNSNRKTFPSIIIRNWSTTWNCQVNVSLVTQTEPHMVHPHLLVGEGCYKGVYKQDIQYNRDEEIIFKFGIQATKVNEIQQALQDRKDQNVDPYKNGFVHNDRTPGVDLKVVCLCFQVFYKVNKKILCLKPVLSTPIRDKNRSTDLAINRISHCSASAKGGQEIMMFCSKVTNNNIKVRFFECDRNNVERWAVAFKPAYVHKQYGIAFRVPPYQNPNTRNNVKVYIQLERNAEDELNSGNKEYSEKFPFEYRPESTSESDPDFKRKREANLNQVLQQAERTDAERASTSTQANRRIQSNEIPGPGPSTSLRIDWKNDIYNLANLPDGGDVNQIVRNTQNQQQ